MSELTRILASRYAKQWRIVDWTLGMSFAAFLIFRWQGYFRTPFAAPADWCGIGLRSWLPLFKEPEGEKRGKVVQLLEKRKISGEESIELVGAVGDRNDKH
jgi:hypothetical protein